MNDIDYGVIIAVSLLVLGFLIAVIGIKAWIKADRNQITGTQSEDDDAPVSKPRRKVIAGFLILISSFPVLMIDGFINHSYDGSSSKHYYDESPEEKERQDKARRLRQRESEKRKNASSNN